MAQAASGVAEGRSARIRPPLASALAFTLRALCGFLRAKLQIGGAQRVRGVAAAKIPATMPSATIAANHRLLLAHDSRPAPHRYTGRFGAFSSPAGLDRARWLERLRRALQDDALVLHYQPIVTLSSGERSHYEALVRLADDPGGRLVEPAQFLAAAERYGLIYELDRLVVRKVAGALADGDDRVAVNLSALSTTDPGMLAHIDGELRCRGVDPSRLVVEITETAAISDIRRARMFCEEVRALGCAVALDDIGAGFGSFYYLKHLPFDLLKIDGHFVRSLPTSLNDQLVVKALVGLARGLGKQTVAEFVGDSATVALLREYGVDHAQGFALGRPDALPARA
jgi:EAL domain-containing protein (putative c-di-GMP-specific phosphodiesterase class I)